MENITQGTIISGLRSKKYKNQQCYGIIISARCDLANEKIEKIFYLIAVPIEDWILSDVGFNIICKQVVSNKENSLKDFSRNNGLSWEDLKGFSVQEFEQVINESNIKNKDSIKKRFEEYIYYTTHKLSKEQKKKMLREYINIAEATCIELVYGKNTQYSFIPESAYRDHPRDGMGIIIDHQELDFIDLPTIKLIDNLEMDCMCLSQKQKEIYNDKFHLLNEPGYVMPECDITSPWIEYAMQRFANVFIRIGVDMPPKQEIYGIIEKILSREDEC